jgi:hypothetical protein
MNKEGIEKYTVDELRKGRTKMEIFNSIVSVSDLNFHSVAEVIRKVPTIEKREKYKIPNLILFSILLIKPFGFIVSLFYDSEISLFEIFEHASINFFFIPSLLSLGIYKFKRNMHLITGVFMLLIFFASLSCSITVWGILYLIGAIIAFYLCVKLPGDYELNRELLKINPRERKNIVTFTE